jgi:hypothetical protein
MNYKLLQTVLLVEDDLDDQELFTTALREIQKRDFARDSKQWKRSNRHAWASIGSSFHDLYGH